MNLPGFTAEAATYGRGRFFPVRTPNDNRSSVRTITMAGGCPAGTSGTCTTTCDCVVTSPQCSGLDIACGKGCCPPGNLCVHDGSRYLCVPERLL
jgi:hypothetical protein